MFLIQNSQSIMHLSIALGFLLIAGFLAWLLFYFVMMVRDVRSIVQKTKETLTSIHDVLDSFKRKIDETNIQFKILLEGMKTILEWVNNRKNQAISDSDEKPKKKTKKK